MANNLKNIRNFCIIAHIDHGKSTLADRLLEITHTVQQREMKEQLLDQMDLERERGITIKLQPVRMEYRYNEVDYTLHLIDTPGHVDFTYEVSRSLQACEGALLVVDAAQGIQAQTLANVYLALEQNLEIIPVINKIDLPAADIPRVTEEIVHLLGCSPDDIIPVSAKTGLNVERLLEALIERVAPPTGDGTASLRALVFDSMFDDYRGVITYVRIVDGVVRAGDQIRFMAKGSTAQVVEVGSFQPKLVARDQLAAGEIGYIVTGLKTVAEARVGDTITGLKHAAATPLPGYAEPKSMVYAGVYAKDASKYPMLREALARLKLNDAALLYEPEHSTALGFGFRCGFLGMLHLDIITERLRREFGLDLIVTTPSVGYRVVTTSNEILNITSPLELPDPTKIDRIEEPMVAVDIVTPSEYVGTIMQFVVDRHGRQRDTAVEYVNQTRVILHYVIPLSAVVVDFYDKLKNISSGYASLNYEFDSYQSADIVCLSILVAEEPVEPLALMVYRSEAQTRGRKIVSALKDVLPRQMFEVKIQAALGAKIVASEKIPALRKDVTAKLYGGDVTRKRKLLEKQKKGKKRMKSIGKVDIPQEAFLTILKR